MEPVLLSIWCIAYNHELYIRDAIEGFLAQKTNFRYEIIIHDDASTDRTPEIIREYEQKYPNLIQGIYQTENQYSRNQPTIKWLWEIEAKNCQGKYIAVCEADDYWIDVQKLQLQVDYLEKHPKCIMTVHDAINVDYRDYTLKPGNIYNRDCIIPPRDIIVQNKYMFSASMVYRKEILQMTGFFLDTGIGDYTSLLYSLTRGDIYYFNRIMSIYRQYHKGSWTYSFSKSEEMRWKHNILMIDFLEKYNNYTKHEFEVYVISRIQKNVLDILESCNKMGKKYFEDTYKKMTKRYQNIFCQLEKLWYQLFDESYLDEDVSYFINRFSKIVIMGAGKYAGILAKQLRYRKIDFEGFVISNNQNMVESYMGKPVWKLDAIPYDITSIGILIGINPIIWEQIIVSLKDINCSNYICPFCWKF